MSSDESDAGPQSSRKRKVRRLASDESPSSASPVVHPRSSRRRCVARLMEESTDSDSDDSVVVVKRKRVGRVKSDSEDSSSSDSVIVRRTRNVAPITEDSDSQWETDFTENETTNKTTAEKPSSSVVEEKAFDSDSSDGQSEKCPICLVSFRLQEIGVPESCDHSFCLECIQEWSKNVNTCPVDRKEYTSISVKKTISSNVDRKITVEKPQAQIEMDIVEDPTFCEVCGSNDNEDRLLLCDGCDLGFHLYCLTPPLQEVPEGAWFCNDCSPDDPLDSELHVDEIFRLLDEANMMFGRAVDLMNPGQRRTRAARLLPRTTQVERVRRRIANNRRPNNLAEPGPSTSTGRSRSNRSVAAATSRRPKKTKKRKKSRRTTISYKTVYEIDEVTGEAVAVKKRVKSKKRKSRSKRKTNVTNRPTSSRNVRSGCRPGASNFDQNEYRRYNAGIPSLDLLGNANRLDYFSDSQEEEYHTGAEQGILLTRTSSTTSEANTMRRVARRKGLLVDVPSTASTTSDILGTILETQERFLSKNAVMTVVDSSGKLDIQQKGGVTKHNNNITISSSGTPEIKKDKNPVFNKTSNVNINSSEFQVRETPYGGRRGGNPHRNRYQNNSNRGGYTSGGSQNYHRRYDDAPAYSSNSGAGGPLDFSRDNFDSSGFGRGRQPPRFGDGDFNTPQDYTQRTLLQRENFDRPRHDERDDRHFPPQRFQDDFPRDDFRFPPEERERDEPNYPPRFQDDLNPHRRETRNIIYSPPRYSDNNVRHEEDYNEPHNDHENDDYVSDPPDFPPNVTDYNAPAGFPPGPPPPPLFMTGPPPNFVSGPPPLIMPPSGPDFQLTPPDFPFKPQSFLTGPPPNEIPGSPPISQPTHILSGPPPDFHSKPPDYLPEPQHFLSSPSSNDITHSPNHLRPPPILSGLPPDFQEKPTEFQPPPEAPNFLPGPQAHHIPSLPESPQNLPAPVLPDFQSKPPDFASEPPAFLSDAPSADLRSEFGTRQKVSEPDFTSDSPPRVAYVENQRFIEENQNDCQDNDQHPETYMPEEPYMPPESEDKPYDENFSGENNCDSADRQDECSPEIEYNPEDCIDEYNPEECTQGSDPEVDIYGDMGEEPAKAPNSSKGNMLPPPEPPMSLLSGNRPFTPSSVPYTPSRPLSPRVFSPKRPYSPPRSYSPSFPTSPPRTLAGDVPYTPSRPFTPNRTPERPSQSDYPITEPYSPTANTDDSENEMVIDTEKNQDEHKDPSTPNTSNEDLENKQEGDQIPIVTSDSQQGGVDDGEKTENNENWERDSDDGKEKKNVENMWEETPAVHKAKLPSNNWDETPAIRKLNNWDETPANNWDETPAPHPKPPPKSIWEREEDELGDGCPNFNIYSRQSKSVALTTDLTISQTKESIKNWDSHTPPKKSDKKVETTFGYGSDPRVKILSETKILSCLYSDSEDESVVKKSAALDKTKNSDQDKMTEDIVSEEERSYTPCRDENSVKQGLEGLDTEMVSEDERNEFEATTADGDALEINAKDNELDFSRQEDCEEGEIFDQNKEKKNESQEEPGTPKEKGKKKKKEKDKNKDKNSVKEKSSNKENEPKETFKKISKSNKERNYRGDRPRSRSKSPKSKEKRKSSKEKSKDAKKKKEKRKEIERYDVRAVISEKPDRPKKDEFGRDIPAKSRSRSRSYTPPLITRLFSSPGRRSPTPKRRTKSPSPRRRSGRERSRSRQRSRGRKRDKSKRSRSRTSRSKSKGRKKDKSKSKKRRRSLSKADKRREGKNKRRARGRSRTPSPRTATAREWTPSLSPSPMTMNMMSPSWTPPRLDPHLEDLRNQVNESLTVMLDNAPGNKNKRDRRRKEKKRDKTSRRRRDRTPPPSKEVFASGDNILVSVSFNNENETRNIRDKRREEERKKKRSKRKDKNKELAGVKPVAIIDLERSPFMEVPSSPKEVIVLSDSDHQDGETSNMATVCDSSQQVASPETRNNFSTGPKTPPEPQVKFSLSTKPSQLRVISNPLHDPEDEMQAEVQEDLNNSMHKGPNTPPEPPTSPPSSPDAYDPFEPTKSRSPTPEPSQTLQSTVVDESHATNVDSSSLDIGEKIHKTPEITKSLTPPVADVQPADSQSSITVSPQLKSPEQRAISNIVSQVIQSTITTVKPVAQTTPFSSGSASSLITSTPISSTITTQRINILNSTVITPTIPQRIVLPNQVKSSPVKISPTKAALKSTPIKPMPKGGKITKKVNRALNGSSNEEITVDLDSPYSPASSDYEDLFEPPPDVVKPQKSISKIQQSHKSVFDTLFGSPSVKKKAALVKTGSAKKSSSKTKHIGVKIDEDSLKILEELPNSAVEMQVKDKFLKKLNRQERVVEEVKLVLKPFYNKKKINKEEYKEIMRRAVPKICHNKTGEINPNKIRKLIEAYVKKLAHNKKVTSSSSIPLLK